MNSKFGHSFRKLRGQEPAAAAPGRLVEALLNKLPQAMLLVDSSAQQVRAANHKAGALTGYAPEELAGLSLSQLFPFWEEQGLPGEAQIIQLVCKDGKSLPVSGKLEAMNPDLGPAGKAVPGQVQESLLALEPVRERPAGELVQDAEFWEPLQILVQAAAQSTPENTLYLALQALADLGGVQTMAVYLLYESGHGLRRSATWGEAHLLPGTIASQDLSLLVEPGSWKNPQRTPGGLQRQAQLAGFEHLVWAPLNVEGRFAGLLVYAGQEKQPEAAGPETLVALAQLVSTLLSEQARRTKLYQVLDRSSLKAATSAAVLRLVEEGVVHLTPNLEILQLNSAAESILGYYQREVAGQSIDKVLIGPETLLPALQEAQKGITPRMLQGTRLYRRNGEPFLSQVKIQPVKGKVQVEGIIVVIGDLTEQELIRERTQQLEQRAMLGEVIAVFAHEVRNPLNNINTGLELMEMKLPGVDPLQENVRRMRGDCERVEEMMKSVLTFSREADYVMSAVDLGLLLKYMIDRMQPKLLKANVQASLQVEPDCPPISGNSRALEQVFSNLMNNAIQAMSPEGGRLALRVQPLPGARPLSVGVSVADTGPGIPRDIQENIFKPFYTTKKDGSGLGLAVSRRILTAHHGSIQVNSFPGGTVFHIQIPALVKESEE